MYIPILPSAGSLPASSPYGKAIEAPLSGRIGSAARSSLCLPGVHRLPMAAENVTDVAGENVTLGRR